MSLAVVIHYIWLLWNYIKRYHRNYSYRQNGIVMSVIIVKIIIYYI